MNKMYSLEQYDNWARRCIMTFVVSDIAQLMLSDNSIVTEVAAALMEGDWKWDGRGNQIGYRKQCGKWAIGKILTRMKKNSKLKSLNAVVHKSGRKDMTLGDMIPDKEIPHNSELMEVALNQSFLTKQQHDYIQEYYVYNKTMEEIADSRNVSRQSVQQVMQRALTKIKQTVFNYMGQT